MSASIWPPADPSARDSLPLSAAQQYIWLLEQLAERPHHNETQALRLSGPLDPRALEQALNLIVSRHAILRTTFTEVDGQPAQQVLPELKLALDVVDLRDLPADERRDSLEQRCADEQRRPFDLQRGPLLRTLLFQLDQRQAVLLVVAHRLIFDGQPSLTIMLRELALIYPALAVEQPQTAAPLPALPLQFGDYAIEQQQWLSSPVAKQQIAYWTHQLADVPPALDLPSDDPRPVRPSFRGVDQPLLVPSDMVAALAALSQRAGTTLLPTLLAAFATLLHCLSSQDEIVVGLPRDGRSPTTSELLGRFSTMLPVRAAFASGLSFRRLLAQVAATLDEGAAHQALPFETLVQALRLERDLSYPPLVQAILRLDEHVEPLPGLPGLALAPLDLADRIAEFDLALTLRATGQGLEGTLRCNADLFGPETAARLAEQFMTLLHVVAADPDVPIAAGLLLSAAERTRLLRDWNATAHAYPADATLPGLIEAQVARTPDATALVFEGQSLSYRALDARANQVARALQRLDVGPDTLVGVCLHRSLDLVVGLLGILKAGAAYVPLDPTYPAERLQLMLDDAQVGVVLSEQALVDALPVHAALLRLDADWPMIAQESDAPLALPVRPEQRAYVIYTSGSTGKPKGVMIPHRAVVNFLTTMAVRPGLQASDVLLAVTTIAFDIAGLELWLPLSVGARVVLASRAAASDGPSLGVLLRASGATVLQATPATWRLLLASGWDGDPHLTALCGGEALPPELAVAVRPRVAALWNLYGPTETTVWSTLALVDAGPLTIGRPIGNTQVYLLDREGQPVPQGVPGELYIGGDGLARGYLDRPALTAERFVPDAFGGQAGARLYRTGDLARYRADGTLEYLGRLDHQVKVRGFRIELGEIESVLRQDATVGQCVVLAREDVPGDQRLVAYVVAAADAAPTATELRSFLAARLPAYMVPSAFVILDALPLTPNGKLDRKALPAPDSTQLAAGTTYVAPRTAAEERVAAIWSELLRVERVGVHDDFFALGGHSLLTTQLLARVGTVFGHTLPPGKLLAAPTVAGLVAQLSAEDADTTAQPPLVPVSRDQLLPLSYAQQRFWFLDQLEPQSTAYLMPVTVRLEGALDVAALSASLAALVVRHEALRTTFPVHDGQPVQRIAAEGQVDLRQVDLTALAVAERAAAREQQLQAAATTPFDLRQAPLVRALLLREADAQHTLLLTMPHIISDGWSVDVLLRDLGALYTAAVRGTVAALPPLTLQYADYAVWQRHWLSGPTEAAQRAYWTRQLVGAPPVLDLPTDYPRPPYQSGQHAQYTLTLPAALLNALQALGQREGATLFMTLLAAFNVLLARLTQQTDLVVGTPIAGRTRAEVEEIIGCFVNTLALRTDLSGDPSFTRALARVREVCLQAYAHQDLPFEQVVDALRPERTRSYHPIFQTLFVLQSPAPIVAAPGLELVPDQAPTPVAQFDLVIELTPAETGLTMAFAYATDLFTPARVARIAGQFVTLLHGIAADPAQPLSALPLLSDAERRQLLVEWSTSARFATGAQRLPDLFAAQVTRTPDAPALVFTSGDQRQELSYRELDERTNQLAHYLQRQGVGPEVLVGLFAERSIELIVGLLAVIKAGGAYIPLDPAYPSDRLRYMLADAQVALLLTQARLQAEPLAPEAQIVKLDADWPAVAHEPRTPPINRSTPDNLAYVIYTSGSTGRPKGAAITHRGIENLVLGQSQHFDPDHDARVLQFASLSFDASIWDVLMALLHGACLVLAGPDELQPGQPLGELMEREGVTHLTLAPAALAALPVDAHPTLRQVMVGGEACPAELVAAWANGRSFSNLYGPTEITIWATVAHVTDSRVRPPIGRPIGNMELYILDRWLEPVPIGVAGELFISAPGLARGYLGRPALTAEYFIPHPFSNAPGARLYRTGDVVRYRSDGQLEFIGRVDDQVKLRGFRIELGEIENTLMQLPDVKAAVVLVRNDLNTSGVADKRLVAYVVPQLGSRPTAKALRTALADRLPDYMLPAVFMLLDELPLTPNGKVDRRALPVPHADRRDLEHDYIAPRTPTEQALAEIYRQLLGLEQIGVDDNVFDLGCHSLMATQVIARASSQFQLQLPLNALFEAPTIATLAERIEAFRWIAREQPVPSGAPDDFEEGEL